VDDKNKRYQESVASYVGDLTSELANLARYAGHRYLADILTMAVVEAQQLSGTVIADRGDAHPTVN